METAVLELHIGHGGTCASRFYTVLLLFIKFQGAPQQYYITCNNDVIRSIEHSDRYKPLFKYVYIS